MHRRIRMLSVSSMLIVAATAGCAGSIGESSGKAASTSASRDLDAVYRQRALSAALSAAQRDARGLVVGSGSPPTSTAWPDGVQDVTAALAPPTGSVSNTGYTCAPGPVLAVRLLGTFNTVIAGDVVNAKGGESGADPAQNYTVREVDLQVDPATGSTCSVSVRTTVVPPSPDETVIYQR